MGAALGRAGAGSQRAALERRFKEALDCSPCQLIERVRLDLVRQSLMEGGLSLAAIAGRTGFVHPEYLTVVFRCVEGMPLREWRARHRRMKATASD